MECDNANNQEPYGYIYITKNLINGKQYIGQHISTTFDKSYKGSGKILKQAFKKYGRDNFITDVIEWCYNRDELAEREKYWISYYNAVNSDDWYNILAGGYGVQLFGENNPMYGKHHTDESKAKISSKLTGLLAGEKNPMYGVHLAVSEETRQKMSQSRKGLMVGEKNPMYGKPSAMRGKHHSEEAKLKNSLAHIGKHYNISPEVKEKLRKQISERMKGKGNPQYGKKGELSPTYNKHPSPETIEKQRLAHKGKQKGAENPASVPIYDYYSDVKFSCIKEVSEYFNITYSQARTRVNKEKQMEYNGRIYKLTRNKEMSNELSKN